MDFLKKIGYVRGLLSSPEYNADQVIRALTDAVESISDGFTDNMDRLEEYLDDLSDTMHELTGLLDAGEFSPPSRRATTPHIAREPEKSNKIHILHPDFAAAEDDYIEPLTEEELGADDLSLSIICPHCKERIDLGDADFWIKDSD